MFTPSQLAAACRSAQRLAQFAGGFDSFTFRKLFEEEREVSTGEKKEILAYLLRQVPFHSPLFMQVRKQINVQEFLVHDYYANPAARKFRGVYAPVVYKTLAGMMMLDLQNDKGQHSETSAKEWG